MTAPAAMMVPAAQAPPVARDVGMNRRRVTGRTNRTSARRTQALLPVPRPGPVPLLPGSVLLPVSRLMTAPAPMPLPKPIPVPMRVPA